MATINKTIASSGADYTSMSLFEASIPGSGSDDYIGTYIEAMTDTTLVVCSFGVTNTMTVDVQAAYRCNGAVSGTHAELSYTTNDANDLLDMQANVTVKNLRIKRTTTNPAGDAININTSGGVNVKLDRCTLIGAACAGRVIRCIGGGTGTYTVTGCFIVDNNRPAGGAANDVVFWRHTVGTSIWYRNTVFLASATAASLLHSNLTGTDIDARENMLIKAAGATATNGNYYSSAGGTYAGTCEANASSGTDTPENTTANESLSPGAVLTTLTVGSEDLHYPNRAAMTALTAGSDLSATVGTVDLDGDTIAAWYPGADYVAAAAGAGGDGVGGGMRLRLGLRYRR